MCSYSKSVQTEREVTEQINPAAIAGTVDSPFSAVADGPSAAVVEPTSPAVNFTPNIKRGMDDAVDFLNSSGLKPSSPQDALEAAFMPEAYYHFARGFAMLKSALGSDKKTTLARVQGVNDDIVAYIDEQTAANPLAALLSALSQAPARAGALA